MIVKVRFADVNGEGGYRSITPVRRVNYVDRKVYIEYVINRLGILADSYTVQPISEIIIEYIPQDGQASNSEQNLQEAEYTVKSHTYNNYQLPLTMNPYDYGEIILKSDINMGIRYVVKNNNRVYQIDQIDAGDGTTINSVTILTTDITYADYSLAGSSTLFKREIDKIKVGKESLVRYVYYIETDKEIVVKTKQLKAKPFRGVKLDPEISSSDCFMTVDIETVPVVVPSASGGTEKRQIPYLICGYTVAADGTKCSIHSFSDVNPGGSASVNKNLDAIKLKVEALFKDFITKLLTDQRFANVKYVYAHNLSGFDGILFLNHLISYENATTKPLIFNSKLMSITFSHKTVEYYTDVDGQQKDIKQTRTLIFKDSLLMLPLSLRKLAKDFDVETQKVYFPYGLSNTSYRGKLPSTQFWTDITPQEYKALYDRYYDGSWVFEYEAVKYCMLDCVCLYEIILQFNKLFYEHFQLNVHTRLTLP